MRFLWSKLLALVLIVGFGLGGLYEQGDLKKWVSDSDQLSEWIEDIHGITQKALPIPARSGAQKSESETLTLASWNIRHLGRSKTAEDIYEIANIVRDFDMVLIQEVEIGRATCREREEGKEVSREL